MARNISWDLQTVAMWQCLHVSSSASGLDKFASFLIVNSKWPQYLSAWRRQWLRWDSTSTAWNVCELDFTVYWLIFKMFENYLDFSDFSNFSSLFLSGFPDCTNFSTLAGTGCAGVAVISSTSSALPPDLSDHRWWDFSQFLATANDTYNNWFIKLQVGIGYSCWTCP